MNINEQLELVCAFPLRRTTVVFLNHAATESAGFHFKELISLQRLRLMQSCAFTRRSVARLKQMTGNFRAIQETIAHTASPGSTIQLVDLDFNTNIYVPPPTKRELMWGRCCNFSPCCSVCVEMFFEEASVVFTEMLHVCLDEPSPLPLLPPPLFLNHSIIAWEILWKWSHYLHFEKKRKKSKENRSICLQSTVARETPRVAHQAAVTHLLGV